MKNRVYYGWLGAEALVCILFTIAQTSFAGVFTAITAFPFEQIGLGLRGLSLSGWAGNAAALLIYTAVCTAPLAVLWFLRKRREGQPEDALLGLLSVMLFAVLYLMINPGVMDILPGGLSVVKAMLGGAVYSLLLGYFILRAIRLFHQSDALRLARYLSVILGLLGAICLYLVCGACLQEWIAATEALRANAAAEERRVHEFFLTLQFVVNALPYVLDIWVIGAALRLLEELRKDRYSEDAIKAAARMTRYCTVALTAMVLANIGFNFLQLLLAKLLATVHISLDIPVFSLAFVLAALLITRFITENKQLKDENDAFI